MPNYVYAVTATAYPSMDVVLLHANVEKQVIRQSGLHLGSHTGYAVSA
jgi:hypothetical protein